jgi:predicted nucleotidyltransferase
MADTAKPTRVQEQTQLDDLVEMLRRNAGELRDLGVTSLAIFGSQARGDARSDSDLDVLIDYANSPPFTLYSVARVTRRLSEITRRKAHVSMRNGFKPKALAAIEKHAVSVF